MRILLLILFACAVIPVCAQQKNELPRVPKNNTVNVDTVNVNKLNIAQQADSSGKADKNSNKSRSYFNRLIAPENLPNLVLSIVGIAGVIAAVCTLRTLQHQTRVLQRQGVSTKRAAIAAHRNAEAALLTAKVMINSERAWIEVDLVAPTTHIDPDTGEEVIGPANSVDSTDYSRCGISIRNHGRTVARIISYKIWRDCFAKTFAGINSKLLGNKVDICSLPPVKLMSWRISM